jgi:excisionase family DNA binding protein
MLNWPNDAFAPRGKEDGSHSVKRIGESVLFSFPTLIRYCPVSADYAGLTETLAMKMTAEAWVSVDDVAGHLGVAKDSVYRWIDARGMPAHRIGRLWKFKISEVDAWVQAGGASTNDYPPSKGSLK